MSTITNLTYGDAKREQMLSSFKTQPIKNNIIEKALDILEKGVKGGKLDTSHLVLKQVNVGGKMMNRWVDPSNGKEHAKHGSKIEFEHKGETKKGTVGGVMGTGEYSIKGEDGKSYAKHPHQFASPHASDEESEESETKASKGEDGKSEKHTKVYEEDEISAKPISKEKLKKLDEEGEDDLDINQKFKAYSKYVRMVAKGQVKSGIAYGTGGVGKAQPLYSKVLTTEGFKTMGGIEMGDEVITPSGESAMVLATFPQGLRPVYEMTFFDGSKVRCDEEHLWKVKDRRKEKWVLLTTKQIIEAGVKSNDKRGWGWNFGTPFITKTFDSPDKKLPIEPYLLGYLLGDGCFMGESLTFTSGSRDKIHTITKVAKLLPKGLMVNKHKSSVTETGTANYGIAQKEKVKTQGKKGVKTNLLLIELENLGLDKLKSHEKFIPEVYKSASPKQKLELIRGLMDSDGYVREDGQTSFGTSSKKLAADFRELVQSFGGFANIKDIKAKYFTHKGEKKLGKPGFEVCFYLIKGLVPVTLPYKVERYKAKKHYSQALSIVDVKYVGEEETKCILIGSEDHLYITDDYVVTHNTFGAIHTLETTINPKTGKPFKEFDEETMTPGSDAYDYVKITGKATTSGVIQAMWEHNGKLLLFDDCDTALTQPDTIMMFKGALDSTGDGKVSALSARPLKDSDGVAIPKTFKFTGRAFFISNLKGNQIDQAIKSRSLRIDLTMDAKQTLERIKHIAEDKQGKLTNIKLYDVDGNKVNYTHEDMDAAIKFLDKYKDKTGDLNVRTLGNIVRLIHDGREEGEDENEWKGAAKSFILAKGNEDDLNDELEKGGVGSGRNKSKSEEGEIDHHKELSKLQKSKEYKKYLKDNEYDKDEVDPEKWEEDSKYENKDHITHKLMHHYNKIVDSDGEKCIDDMDLKKAFDTLLFVEPTELEKAFSNLLGFEKAEFSEVERKKLSKKGEAEKDGSYPIEDENDLKNAIRAFGRSKNPEKTKAWIKKRAKELDKESLLPANWKKSDKVEKAFDNLLGDLISPLKKKHQLT